jgi:hypothetical protein
VAIIDNHAHHTGRRIARNYNIKPIQEPRMVKLDMVDFGFAESYMNWKLSKLAL